MEIYSAENHARLVVEFLEKLHQDSPKMYNTTRNRLRSISSDCFRSIELISKILEEDSLIDEEEFSQDRNEIQQLAAQMHEDSDKAAKQIDELTQFTSTSTVKLTAEERRYLVKYYGKVLSGLAAAQIPYSIAADCAKILWRWYSARFFKGSVTFKYNVAKISTWIRDIVITYGLYQHNHIRDMFIAEFDAWCDNIFKYSYPVPYIVHSTVKQISDKVTNLESLCLWDILVDYGLIVELPNNLQDFQLSRYAVSDIFDKYSPNLTNEYEYYNSDKTLLQKYNLLRGDEI